MKPATNRHRKSFRVERSLGAMDLFIYQAKGEVNEGCSRIGRAKNLHTTFFCMFCEWGMVFNFVFGNQAKASLAGREISPAIPGRPYFLFNLFNTAIPI